MITSLTWKAETKALSKIKQSADKRLGLTLDAQHGHVRPSPPARPALPGLGCLFTCACVSWQTITSADRKWAKSLKSSSGLLTGVSHLAL